MRGQKLFLANNEWRATTKPGKLYLTFFAEPRATFEIPAMKNKLLRAYRLADKAPVDAEDRERQDDVQHDGADSRSDGDRGRRRIRWRRDRAITHTGRNG